MERGEKWEKLWCKLKKNLVDSKQKVLSAVFTWTNSSKCELSSPFEILIILQSCLLITLYPFTARASSGVDYLLLAKNIVIWVVKADPSLVTLKPDKTQRIFIDTFISIKFYHFLSWECTSLVSLECEFCWSRDLFALVRVCPYLLIMVFLNKLSYRQEQGEVQIWLLYEFVPRCLLIL